MRVLVKDVEVGGRVHETNGARECALAHHLKTKSSHPNNLLQEDNTVLGVKLVFYF